MKKIIAMTLIMMSVLTAAAQGGWSVSYRQADPLINQDARSIYMYDAKGVGSLVIWDWSKPAFRLITDRGFFHQVRVNGAGICVPVNVGFYDNQGNLKKKFVLIMFCEDNHQSKFIATGAYYTGGRGNIRKLFDRLRAKDGYVRFVADLHGEKFDMIVPPYQKP